MASRSILAALPPSLSIAASSSRRGRPAQAGERYPSGKLKPPSTPPAQVRRMLDMARRDAADPILATPIGWLRLHELVTDADVAAAIAYATKKGEYDRVINAAPSRSAKSPSYQTGRSFLSNDETLTAQQEDALRKYEASVRRRYGAMLDCLANAKQRELLDRVCVDDEHPSAWEMTDLLAALACLVKHLRLGT